MTKANDIKSLTTFINDEKKIDNIYYMKGRWSDEKEYEDFDEYKEVMKKHLRDSGFIMKSMTQGFVITIVSKETSLIYKITFNWKNIKTQQVM